MEAGSSNVAYGWGVAQAELTETSLGEDLERVREERQRH